MGEKQIIYSPLLFSKDNSFDDDRFMKVRIAAMHDGINRNNSNFSIDTIKDAEETFKNIPILANVVKYKDKDGNETLDYGGHDFHIEADAFNEDETRLIYDEKVVGVVPESNNFEIIYDSDTGKNYVWVDALLYRDYGNYVCDILESREGKTDVSMEIICDDMSYSTKDNSLHVGSMTASAITMLGANVEPAMKNAHIESYSVDRREQVVQIMQELKQSLDNYIKTANAAKVKEGGKGALNKFEELLEKYGKTAEDIDFEYADLDDESLETAFAKAFADSDEPDEDEAEVDGEIPADNEDDEPADGTDEATNEDSESDAEDDSKPLEDDTSESESTNLSISFSKTGKVFSVSLSEIIYALSDLVNVTYAEDGYYYVDVYADDKYIIMHNYYDNKIYKQSYKIRKGEYQLTGERIEVHAQYLTPEEEAIIDELRKDYSVLEEKIHEYEEKELHEKREEVFSKNAYSAYLNDAEFVELKSNMDKYTVDELQEKAELAFAKCVQKLGFSLEENEQAPKNTRFGVFAKADASTKGRYGSIFKK